MTAVRASGATLAILVAMPALVAQQPEQGVKPVAQGRRAMVSISHPDVTRTALGVLRKGGNAVDAALTAMLCQHVVGPQMSTPAGGFGALISDAKTNRAYYLDAELDHTHGAPIARFASRRTGSFRASGRSGSARRWPPTVGLCEAPKTL